MGIPAISKYVSVLVEVEECHYLGSFLQAMKPIYLGQFKKKGIFRRAREPGLEMFQTKLDFNFIN